MNDSGMVIHTANPHVIKMVMGGKPLIQVGDLTLVRPPPDPDGAFAYLHPIAGTVYATRRADVAAAIEYVLVRVIQGCEQNISILNFLIDNEPAAYSWID